MQFMIFVLAFVAALLALEGLSENHRAVLVMRELEGLSYEEMASVMNCSKGTIMSRLFHARKNMQKKPKLPTTMPSSRPGRPMLV